MNIIDWNQNNPWQQSNKKLKYHPYKFYCNVYQRAIGLGILVWPQKKGKQEIQISNVEVHWKLPILLTDETSPNWHCLAHWCSLWVPLASPLDSPLNQSSSMDLYLRSTSRCVVAKLPSKRQKFSLNSHPSMNVGIWPDVGHIGIWNPSQKV